jgi:outer membrane protein assembly factor BamB
MVRTPIAWLLALLGTVPAPAADWPQFLGPNRDGTTPETVEPWTGPLKPLWTAPVGESHSSPVIAGGRVYAFYEPKGQNADALAAFDAASGKLLWEKSYDRPEFKPLFGNGPRSTPVVGGGKVFTLGGTGILACWDARTGDRLWKVDTLAEFKTKNLFFGVSTSPILLGPDRLAVMVGGRGAGIVAFDTATGKTAWQATDDPASYSSPVLANNQLIVLTGAHLLGLSRNGEKLWAVPFRDKLNESSTTPVVAGDIVIGSSVTAGAVAVRIGEKDGRYTPEPLWKNEKLSCYFSTPVVVGEHLYMVNSTGQLLKPTIVLRCVELKTGKVLWEKPLTARYHAAALRCGPAGKERLLLLDDNGNLALLEPNPTGYKELAKTRVCGETWAHPALVDGKLYLRDDKNLICLPLN